jgi:hypothetical protein
VIEALTRDEIIARNIQAVEAHFHNENPEGVDNAIALYTDDISWEAPSRGIVLRGGAEVKASYLDIFKSVHFHKQTSLRRFATEDVVFDDQIIDLTVTADLMPNLPFKKGARLSVRLAHIFEMRDGKIAKEIAYEIWREKGSPEDIDRIPDGARVTVFDD